MKLPMFSAHKWRKGKSVFLSEAEYEMLMMLAEATCSPSASDCIRLLISHEVAEVDNGNRQRSEFISIRNRMNKRQSYRLSEDEQQALNHLCEFFGDTESAVIRHLIRFYYAEYREDADNE